MSEVGEPVLTTETPPPCSACGSVRTYWFGVSPDGSAPMAGCGKCQRIWPAREFEAIGGFRFRRRSDV